MELTKIYSLIDPTTEGVRYIGKTDQELKDRLYGHINEAKTVRTHKGNWIQKLIRDDLKPIIELIDEVPKNNWEYWEKYWVAQMKCWGFRLVNGTPGGDNPPVCTENKPSTIVNMSKAKDKKKKAVLVFDMNDKFIAEYDSICSVVTDQLKIERWISTGIKNKKFDSIFSVVSRICNHTPTKDIKRGRTNYSHSCKGFKFKFK